MDKFSKIGAAVAVAIGLGGAGQAQAGFLAAFEGYSVFGVPAAGGAACPQCDSTVSFAVYENNGNTGNWFSDLGVARVDQWHASTGAEKYVYMYEIVNTDPLVIPGTADSPLENFNATWGPKGTANPFVSGGYLNGSVFQNVSRQIVVDQVPNDGVPDALQLISPIVAGVGVNPNLLRASNEINNWCSSAAVPGVLDECMLWDFAGVNNIPAGGMSSILFLTSNYAPTEYRWGETESPGGFGTAGDLPSIPEPGTIALLGLGLAGLGFTKRRRVVKA